MSYDPVTTHAELFDDIGKLADLIKDRGPVTFTELNDETSYLPGVLSMMLNAGVHTGAFIREGGFYTSTTAPTVR